MADIEEDLAPGKDTELEQEVTEFDWSDTGSVILPEQPETAIYHNERGDLVIRQRALVKTSRSSLPPSWWTSSSTD